MEGLWLRFLDVVTPAGGAVVAFAEIYIDETGTHAGSPILGVAGYVFKKGNAKRFSSAWAAECRAKNIPFFHMADCAPGNAMYKGWSKEDRLNHEKKLIYLIKKYSEFGFAMMMSEELYLKKMSETQISDFKPYAFLLAWCLSSVENWISNSKFAGRPAFFFESGHMHASEANDYILKTVNASGHHYSFAPFAFVNKRDAPPLTSSRSTCLVNS